MDAFNIRYNCLWFSEDLLPCHFTDSGIENVSVVLQGILEYGIVYMLLRGDRKSSWTAVWKDNVLGIRRGWYNDAHRERINGRSRRWRRVWVSRRKFQQEDQEEPGNVSKTVTLFLFDFEFLTYEYISWPDMYRGHLTKTNMRTRCLAWV